MAAIEQTINIAKYFQNSNARRVVPGYDLQIPR
jgi:hypothetical protein